MKDAEYKELFRMTPGIDYNIGCRYFLGNIHNYTQALLSTLKSSRSKIPILYSMYQSREYEGFRLIIQTLRRMFYNIGASDIAELSYKLELSYLNRDENDFCNELDAFIGRLYDFTCRLEDLLKKLDLRGCLSMSEEQTPLMGYDLTRTRQSIKLSQDFIERKII